MKRRFLLAGLAIAVLFGMSITTVLLLTGQPRSADAQPVALGTGALPPPVPISPPVAPPPPPSAPPWRDPVLPAPAARNAPARELPSPLVANRVIRKRVLDALRAAPIQSRLARCVDWDVGFGGGAAAGPVPRGKPAVLLLQLEAPGGVVRIADAQVRDWGGASESMMSCARNVLRGEVIAAPKIPRAERMWMPFPLNPRSEAVAVTR